MTQALRREFNSKDYVNHACFDDIEKKSLDNDCHYQKGGECECMYI